MQMVILTWAYLGKQNDTKDCPFDTYHLDDWVVGHFNL